MKKIKIFNILITDIDKNKILQMCLDKIQKKKKIFIITLNSLMVINYLFNKQFFKAVKNADLIIPDGYGIILAGNIFHRSIKNHLPGIDLTYNLLGMAHDKKFSVFLLGSTWQVIDKVFRNFKKWFAGAKFLGRYYGYFDLHEEKKLIAGINKVKPDILLVGIGTPKQEIWINDNLKKLEAQVIMGIGGSFDVISGKKKRAPIKWRERHLEWLYRSITSPAKIINLFKILFYCLIMLYFKLFKK